jgi:hypothetical protein
MRRRCWYTGCRRRTGLAPLTIGRERFHVCWVHACEAAFLLLEWAGDPDRARKYAAYSAQVIRRVNAR